MTQDWCHIFINGTGFLNDWKCEHLDENSKLGALKLTHALGPDIQGLHSFKGKLMHSANWEPGMLVLSLPRA